MILDIMAIPLTQGLFALVDGEDYEELTNHKWRAAKIGTAYYAVRNARKKKGAKRKMILMHRQILNAKAEEEVDHRHGCSLDNRKVNMRICTHAQNLANQKLCKNKDNQSSKFKGVYWHKTNQKWAAHIKHNYKSIHLGLFNNETDAAKAYDKRAEELFGEFAKTNF